VDAISVIYLDTHVVLWTYFGEREKLSKTALEELDSSALMISPAVMMEMQVLYEVGKSAVPPDQILGTMHQDFDLIICRVPFLEMSRQFLTETWTRDPFDRMIVAHAKVSGARLLTKDRNILAHYGNAVW
jgi:PIN domain nuclease of toxin-antitoxin system